MLSLQSLHEYIGNEVSGVKYYIVKPEGKNIVESRGR